MKETNIDIRLIPKENIKSVLPFLIILNEGNISEVILEKRLLEMAEQNYECAGIFENEKMIGVSGLWFQTRHYAGRSIEMDHVIILESHRNMGIGKKLLDFVYDYADAKNCRWVELNTYVHNFPSHKFYYNHGFVAKGYHFVKDITQE